MRDSIAYLIVRAIAWIVLTLPPSFSRRAAEAIAHVAYFLDRRKEIAYANLKAAFGREKSAKELRRIARGSYVNLARTFVEVLRFPSLGRDFLKENVIDQIPKELERLMAPYEWRGVIFVSAHLGNWELAHVIWNLRGFPLKVVARTQPLTKLDGLLNSYRSVLGTQTIRRGMGMREAFRALKKGERLAFAQDQSGGADGAYARFFGRLTSFPLGAFKIGRRVGVPVFPALLVRSEVKKHTLIIEDARVRDNEENEDQAARRDLEYFVSILERYIREYPDQWLWMHKRWKYTRTKFITLLLDEKAGHTGQSRAVLNLVRKTYREQNPEYEVIVHEISIRFKSIFHRLAAYVLAILAYPWLQGRLGLIAWTLHKDSQEKTSKQYADVVISTGSAILPIHAAFAKENKAKKIVVMKPPFPYSLLRYEVALIPEHDRPSSVRDSFFVDLAPNLVDSALLREAGERLRGQENLPKGRYLAVLLGGDTKGFEFDLVKMDFAFWEIRRVCEHFGVKILLTTSRRTSPRVEALVKKHFQGNVICPLLVIANEKNIANVTFGMMALAEAIIVTEDSISMISESIQSGKPVVVLQIAKSTTRRKFERFQQMLKIKNYALLAQVTELGHELSSILEHHRILNPCLDRERVTHHLAGAL